MKKETLFYLKAAACAALTLSLAVMMLYIVYLLNLTRERSSFDLGSVISEGGGDEQDLSRSLLPEFIGITSDGEKSGISGSANITLELYGELSGVICEVMRGENLTEMSVSWDALEDYESSVYVRYYTALPDCVIGIFADPEGEWERAYSYVYEMYLLPTDGRISIAVRDKGGVCAMYSAESGNVFTGESVRKMREDYRTSMYSYEMRGGEPVFLDSVITKNIIISPDTAQSFTENEMKLIMRFFALNPDKLLSSHSSGDGENTFVDTHGRLTIGPSAVEYTSSSDGGIGINDFIGHTCSGTLEEYIQASAAIISYIRSFSRNYVGGDADIYFYSAASSDSIVTLSYMYAFDGIRIEDIEPAFTAVFENGILRSARLYTISVRNLGDRVQMMSEGLFIDIVTAGGNEVYDASLVYRADFVSESVRAEWKAECAPRGEEDDDGA